MWLEQKKVINRELKLREGSFGSVTLYRNKENEPFVAKRFKRWKNDGFSSFEYTKTILMEFSIACIC